jgi:DNA repair protein RadC
MKYKKQEEFRVLLLDSKKRLIRQCTVSIGTIDKAYVHPRDVFRPAVGSGATSIIIVHNHPSGDPEPSQADYTLTRELCMCSKIVDIEILDHIIIGFSDHVSMKEKGGVIINEIK